MQLISPACNGLHLFLVQIANELQTRIFAITDSATWTKQKTRQWRGVSRKNLLISEKNIRANRKDMHLAQMRNNNIVNYWQNFKSRYIKKYDKYD